jgi:cell division cycle 20-like protein 1 (cofactor of APC complex)
MRASHVLVTDADGLVWKDVSVSAIIQSSSTLWYADHRGRVSSLAWNGQTLASGSKDAAVHLVDARGRAGAYAKIRGHRHEICGLAWAPGGGMLASGGNDNLVNVWAAATGAKEHTFTQHQAAVKALAWSPHQNHLLASGGGTADRHIRFWNTQTGAQISSVDTGSQVCNLMWSKTCNELVSTHGYSLNQIIVWKYPSMQKLATLTGHTYRVLFLAMHRGRAGTFASRVEVCEVCPTVTIRRSACPSLWA